MAENHKEPSPNLLDAFEKHHSRHQIFEKFLSVLTLIVLIVAVYVFFLIYVVWSPKFILDEAPKINLGLLKKLMSAR